MHHVPDDNIEMFRVRRLLDGGTRASRLIRLVDIWRPVELVPRFGKTCPLHWTAENSVELAKEFYVNCFTDKETYQTVF